MHVGEGLTNLAVVAIMPYHINKLKCEETEK